MEGPSVEVNLEDLWRFGIPVSIRRILWPFKIGNRLGISKELYKINRKQGLALRDKVLSLSNEFDLNSLSNSNIKEQHSGGPQSQDS